MLKSDNFPSNPFFPTVQRLFYKIYRIKTFIMVLRFESSF